MNLLEWANLHRNQHPGRTVLDVLGARQAAMSGYGAKLNRYFKGRALVYEIETLAHVRGWTPNLSARHDRIIRSIEP